MRGMSNVIRVARSKATRRRRGRSLTLLTLGALSLLGTSYIHWHLWDAEGYRHIPTIGWLFLLQWISGIIIALTLLVVRELWITLAAAGFVASTLVGFLLSVTNGLFGFQDSWLAPYAKSAFVLEVAALVILVLASITIYLDARTTE